MQESDVVEVKQKHNIKIEYCLLLVAVYPNGQSATFFISSSYQHRKNEVLKVIKNKNEVSKDLEKALQALDDNYKRLEELVSGSSAAKNVYLIRSAQYKDFFIIRFSARAER